MAVRLQIRNDTSTNWTSVNPILAVGELAIERDTRKFKIGDGNTAWNSLLYVEQLMGPQGETGDSLEYIWDGTSLGVRVEGETTYTYVDLQGPQGIQGPQGLKGDTGDTGPQGPQGDSLEFVWSDTSLGVRVEGETTYTYVDLEGPQGPPGSIENLTSTDIVTALGFTPATDNHTHTGVYEPADATILKDADIGVTVQGYNPNTVVDANYVHTDNNYTTSEKNKLAGINISSGTTNPSNGSNGDIYFQYE